MKSTKEFDIKDVRFWNTLCILVMLANTLSLSMFNQFLPEPFCFEKERILHAVVCMCVRIVSLFSLHLPVFFLTLSISLSHSTEVIYFRLPCTIAKILSFSPNTLFSSLTHTLIFPNVLICYIRSEVRHKPGFRESDVKHTQTCIPTLHDRERRRWAKWRVRECDQEGNLTYREMKFEFYLYIYRWQKSDTVIYTHFISLHMCT